MNFACGHDISITYSDCVFIALGMQHAMHMRHFILSSVACLALYHIFPHYLIKGTTFEKKSVMEHKTGVLIFSATFV
jgi:hypothetical protein